MNKLGFRVYDCYSIIEARKHLLDEDDRWIATQWLKWVLKHTPSWTQLIESGPHLAIAYGLIREIKQKSSSSSACECECILGDIEYEMYSVSSEEESKVFFL